MIGSLTLLLGCQFVGEVLVRAVGAPFPGAVVGLLILLAILIVRDGPGPELRSTSDTLLRYLALLFVPAGVGIVSQLDMLGRNWLPVTVAVLVSTALGLVVTGVVMQRLAGRST
jgi:holin-like protein